MALYSFKGAWPTRLPNRIKLSNGLTKTDKTTFTQEDLTDAGWFEVEDPPAATYPNKLEWDGNSWYVREPNKSEASLKWQEIRNECNRKLFETDYKVIKAMELGETLDPAITQYRQDLRDLYNNVNDVDPWTVKYPVRVYPDEEANTAIETANTP